MKLYYFDFYGRNVGAIGADQFLMCSVIAKNEDAARLKLYDKFEHIIVRKIQEADAEVIQYKDTEYFLVVQCNGWFLCDSFGKALSPQDAGTTAEDVELFIASQI